VSDPDAVTTAAVEQAKDFRAMADKLRERSDATAKGLATLGTAAITAIGIAKFADLYPWPPGEWPATGALLVGFLLITAVLVTFTIRLWSANRPFLARPDLDEPDLKKPKKIGRWGRWRRWMDPSVDAIDHQEWEQIKPIFDRTAHRNDAADLEALQAQADQFQRIVDGTDDERLAANLERRAARMRAEIDVAIARAQLVVVRRRINRVFTDTLAIGLAVAFVLGLLAFGIGADRLDSERSQRIDVYKACLELPDKVKDVPDICRHAFGKP
jgi:hypothetical protein